MGSWQLEVFKMALYVLFPVASFHVFNQPQIYEKHLNEAKETLKAFHSEEFKEKVREIRLKNFKAAREKRKSGEEAVM